MPLPINIESLLNSRTVESERIEFKEGWNPDAIYRTVCAFANDFDNIGGGYILVGVREENGIAQRPVLGVETDQLDAIQRAMIGFNNLIRPFYAPKLFIEEVDGRHILILWVPGGSNRPYEVPEAITAREKRFCYYIRKYASSVKANLEEQQELISLANKVPFDDRANTTASIDDISMLLVRNHLRVTGSRLAPLAETRPKAEILGQMELLSGPVERQLPRNVALMLFSEEPQRFFPVTRIEVAQFPNGAADPEFIEVPPFTGPVQKQIQDVLSYFRTNVLKEKVLKVPGQAEARRVWNYPYLALEEAIANAIYHRDYQQREPVEVRIYPHSIVILNYGGPDRSIRMEAFQTGNIRPRRYRNRRLGDFLKELKLTEGKATGIPTIRKELRTNGSPEPHFDTDEDRTFFQVELFIHPAFIAAKDQVSDQVKDQVSDQVKGQRQSTSLYEAIANTPGVDDKAYYLGLTGDTLPRLLQILEFAVVPVRKKEIFEQALGMATHNSNIKRYLDPLIDKGLIALTDPDKPTSRNQRYFTTEKGKHLLQVVKQASNQS